jgi:hypothetical protein
VHNFLICVVALSTKHIGSKLLRVKKGRGLADIMHNAITEDVNKNMGGCLQKVVLVKLSCKKVS